MNSQRYMNRKVLRALLRRPLGGLRFLLESAAAIRRGPAGPKKRGRQ